MEAMQQNAPLCRLTGEVVHGRGLGRKVDMPTANLAPDPGSALPPLGVYASLCTVDGEVFLGVTNVGLRPTVDDEERVTVETFLLDIKRDFYGKRMALTLVAFLRPTRKMASLDEVKAQVETDGKAAREILAPYRGENTSNS